MAKSFFISRCDIVADKEHPRRTEKPRLLGVNGTDPISIITNQRNVYLNEVRAMRQNPIHAIDECDDNWGAHDYEECCKQLLGIVPGGIASEVPTDLLPHKIW